MGGSLEPAAIHDWLYSVGEKAETKDRSTYRKKVDQVFHDALQDNDVGLATRTIMYLAVRMGGGGAYGRDDEWQGRFRDPVTGDELGPPFDKPATATIATINCDEFLQEAQMIVACASTDPSLRFVIDREQEERDAILARGFRCLPTVGREELIRSPNLQRRG